MFNFSAEEGSESPIGFITIGSSQIPIFAYTISSNEEAEVSDTGEDEGIHTFKARIKNSMFGYECDFFVDVQAKNADDAILLAQAIDRYAEVALVHDEPRRAGDLGEFLARSIAASTGADADAVFNSGRYAAPGEMGYNTTGEAGWPHARNFHGGGGGSSYAHSPKPLDALLDSLISTPDQSREIEPGVLPDDLVRLDVEWIDLSTEDFREYERPSGDFYTIEDPRWLYISPTKNHYVIDMIGMVHVIHADMSRPILRWVADPILHWLPTS